MVGTIVSARFNGVVREPMLKVIHIVRAMEYKDEHGGPVIFQRLQDVIVQGPIQSSKSSLPVFSLVA